MSQINKIINYKGDYFITETRQGHYETGTLQASIPYEHRCKILNKILEYHSRIHWEDHTV